MNDNETSVCVDLKVIATFKSLNWKGEVVTKVVERTIQYFGYDPVLFLEAVCKNDFREIPAVTSRYVDFMEEVFGFSRTTSWRAESVETEVLGGLKFVLWRKHEHHIGDWEIAQ